MFREGGCELISIIPGLAQVLLWMGSWPGARGGGWGAHICTKYFIFPQCFSSLNLFYPHSGTKKCTLSLSAVAIQRETEPQRFPGREGMDEDI